jgi:hypothetical protein|tara:strand:- start:36 stop:1310 length:1275 start_codon:yes stop_codon:yes gene_type:complete
MLNTKNTPPSIKEVHTGEVPAIYEGYLYRFTDMKTNKVYVGVHKGYVGDGYWHSSTDLDFKKTFSDSNSILKFEILEYGNYAEMTVSERKILKDNDARNNPIFINKSNGSAKFFQPDNELMLELHTKILNREFPVTYESIDDVYELERLQVRAEESKELRLEIKERINDAGGNTDGCNPVVIYEGRQSGNDIVGDGNHTLGGAKDAKHSTVVPVIRIPKEVHEQYTNSELKGVSNLQNKRPETIKKAMDIDDAVKYIVGVYADGTPYDSNGNKAYLELCGFTKRRIATILKKSKVEIDKNNLALANELWIDYNSKSHRATLNATVEGFRDSNTISLAYSSAMFKWDNIFDTIFAHCTFNKETKKHEPTKTNIVITVHHPTPDSEDVWVMGSRPMVQRKLRYYLLALGYSFRVHEMPSTMINKLD